MKHIASNKDDNQRIADHYLGKDNYPELIKQLSAYSGVSVVSLIVSHTQKTLSFLNNLGINFCLRKNLDNDNTGISVLEYMQRLQLPKHSILVTQDDKKHICSTIEMVLKYNPVNMNETHHTCVIL